MLRFVGCVTQDHDLKLVALAAAICAFACYTTVHMLSRASASSVRMRPVWLAAAAAAFGTGVWTTHFVAMLAFDAGMPVGYAVSGTIASLALAIGFSTIGFSVLLGPYPRTLGVPLAAVFLSAGIALMHYVGMATLLLPGELHFDPGGVVASIATSVLFSVAALTAFHNDRRPWAAALLVLAVCGLHFSGMASLHILPNGFDVPRNSLPTGPLALAVAASGMLVVALSFASSMLDQRLAARSMQETARLRQFADATFEGILFETEGVIADANAALGALLERPPEALVGRALEAVFTAATVERLSRPHEYGVMTPIEGELLRADGSVCAVEVLRRPIAGTAGHVVLAVRDLSERRAAEQRIEHLAHHDPLTGLANRLLFGERLTRAVAAADRSQQGLALLCLDLDGFKAVNDLMGHPVGDRVLAQVAARLAAAVRETDTAARLGGDEFAVIQSLASQPESAAALAERLIAELGRPYEVDDRTITIGVSVGIALYPSDGASPETLARHADLALYRAKNDGRGVWRFFKPEMDQQSRQRRALEADLREALGRGELALHYQPLFDGETLRPCGYEALLRWTHPTRGNVPPAQFIPLAEECGLIDRLGRWTLEQACAQAASWPRHLRIAVNLSPVQFRQPDLVGTVAAILHRNGLDPARLELEITEGVLIDDAERALAILRQLKALGVRIALDDFGTGYSSLSYLRRFPFDNLKIDKSFIQALGDDADADAIVRSIIAMAHSLRLDVTAEGVETEAQLASLRAERCSQVQGFLLGRPAAATIHPVESLLPAEAAD